MNHLHAVKTQLPPREFETDAVPLSYPSAMSERSYFSRSPSPHTRNTGPGAMAEAITASKSPGLIRRFSRGAHNKLRRRTSQQHSMRMQDQSAGPLLVRKRSDSNGASDFGQEVSDLELDNSNDGRVDDLSQSLLMRGRFNALGINSGQPSNALRHFHFEGGIAPSISAILQRGTEALKHTNKSKKTKRITIWLDPNSARVCWHPTKTEKSFFIDDVRDVRIGVESRNARDDAHVPDEDEERWMTIVYEPPERSKGRTIKTMHLFMPSHELVRYWDDALSTVTRERTQIMNALASSTEKSERGMSMAWKQAMERKPSGTEPVFTLDDARWLCRKLEINCSDHAVRTHFATADDSRSVILNYGQFQNFVKTFKGRKDIQRLYRNINYGTDLELTVEAFLKFLKDDQAVDVEKDRLHWEGLFEKFAKPGWTSTTTLAAEGSSGQRTLGLQGFQNFMTSGFNSPLSTNKGEAVLDRPLNEYFISSSHNTYLLGRQVAGASSVEGYIAALIKGCRCIEIDCWDGEGGRPVVTHGRTMTTKVSFEDCVSTIARYAFHSTPYPLIISLEVHCNPEQQQVMVDLMHKYWKGVMITEPIMTNTIDLPSPEELKSKIIVKVKTSEDFEAAMPVTDPAAERSRARSLGSTFAKVPAVDNRGTSLTPLVRSPGTSSPSDTNLGSISTPRGSVTSPPYMTPNSSADDSEDNPISPEKPRKRKTKIIHELGKLGVYAQGIKFSGWDVLEAKTPNHIFSFNENTFATRCSADSKFEKAQLEQHNMRYLMRVYPGARRIDSSNFNPLQVWRRGVQMAALNWQTFDVHQQVNEAMFAAGSDRQGYVLKPEELRPAKHLPIEDPRELVAKKDKKGKKVVKFSVELISAQRLPRPRSGNIENGMNPYIEFDMYSADDKAPGNAYGEGGTDASARDGSSGIGSPLRKRTKIVEGNGFDPQYNESLTMTVETKYTSLIFVRFTVWNSPEGRITSSNNTLLATFTAKLSSLRQGYRHLPLYNPQGEQYRDAKLFVKIKKEAPIPLHQTEERTYGMITDTAASPRPEASREVSWRRRVFSRNPSSARRSEQHSDDGAGLLSRTSSMDRESGR